MKFRSIAILLVCLSLLAGAALAVEVETVTVSTVGSANSAPVAENLSISTYRDVSVSGTFQAVDPEGDLLTFRITAPPGKGSVAVRGSGFVYTPAAGKRGRDRFSYQAVDAEGNASADATVSIRIEKQAGPVSYPELSGKGLQYAAVRLAEKGVFTGEKINDCWCFSPDTPLKRGDFLTMCAALTGMEPLEDVTRTGFFDDDSITVGPRTTADDIEDWDSLEHIALIVSMEKEFNLKFDLQEVNKLENVGEMVDLIISKL